MKPYPWQEIAWQRLHSQHEQHRMPHALLLTGQAGLGKLHFAKAFAQFLQCTQPSFAAACDECQACHLYRMGNHPDVYLVQPQTPSKVIKIEQIRNICNDIQQTARLKIILIEPAESMHIHAANALLKTLEEPNGNTVIFLISHCVAQVPVTIKSRCQTIAFYPQPSLSEEWLADKMESKSAWPLLERLSGGSPLMTLQASHHTGEYWHLGRDLLRLSSDDPQQVIPHWLAQDTVPIWQWLAFWISDFIRLKNKIQISYLAPMAKELSLWLGVFPTKPLFVLYDKLLVAQQLAAGNVNKQLLLEDFFYTWQRLFSQGR